MISLIAAHDANRGIGINNTIPWHIPNDFEHFKMLTVGKVIIMGRKTFESMNSKLLPNRITIVLSSNPGASLGPNHYWSTSLEGAIQLAKVLTPTPTEIMIIGGSMIYELALPYANRIYTTEIEKSYACDAFFPNIPGDFVRIFKSRKHKHQNDDESKIYYRFMIYDKNY